jgi:hypothetical protein
VREGALCWLRGGGALCWLRGEGVRARALTSPSVPIAAGTCTDTFSDFIVGHGELWSAQLMTLVIKKLGGKSTFMDARKVLTVEASVESGQVDVDYEMSTGRLSKWFEDHPNPGIIVRASPAQRERFWSYLAQQLVSVCNAHCLASYTHVTHPPARPCALSRGAWGVRGDRSGDDGVHRGDTQGHPHDAQAQRVGLLGYHHRQPSDGEKHHHLDGRGRRLLRGPA